MGDKSTIEWTDATWNPVTGCDTVSPGCDHCYARTLAVRLKAMGQQRYQNDGDPRTSGPGFAVTLQPDQLSLPMRWRNPRMVFVNSMSDLFHSKIPTGFIAEVFAVMAATPQHTYQVLTKRHGRMRALLADPEFRILVQAESATLAHEGVDVRGPGNPWETWPLPNVWMGVSVEDQQRADLRIPALLRTPAAVRWLSMEPLLGPVDLGQVDALNGHARAVDERTPLDWVVAGGESGPGHRHMNPAWIMSIRDQCVKADVPFFFKQWGGRRPKEGGRTLEGRTWDQMPASYSTTR